ncbi:Inositol monophosphatase family protein [Methylobacterium sp. UNC300MFChir4.1]|uniref:inositol monophosphatase family protein n=1 Tax=Methylobacterium sp. UNC300MFChir4.1 TaxID=1502747 RepID=UPI0008AF8C9E|nr:inositol monophosphatase family protein [Methylobacterium sp. UNC300MFChir4.1]SEM89071.1 Inositol monophosphatase family protein [Methylobacterium sp. UNC300MFChir4.1]
MTLSPTAPAPDVLAAMLAFAEEAAPLALAMRAGGLAMSNKGPDLGQALTEADLAVSRLMHARFGPDLIEEETAEDLGQAAARALLARDAWTFVGDPIDGTRPFAGGLSGWGVMVAACRGGWPRACVMSLPAWNEDRSAPAGGVSAEATEGLLLAASEGRAYWAPTRGGRTTTALRPLERPERRTGHVGWLSVTAQRYTLDYGRGWFPWSEGGAISDAALLATGRLDATLSNNRLWDLGPILPLFEALGFRLFHWPDLGDPPADFVDLFDAELSAHDDLWLVCRDRAQAADLATAIRPA